MCEVDSPICHAGSVKHIRENLSAGSRNNIENKQMCGKEGEKCCCRGEDATTALCRQMEKLRNENTRLTNETITLKKSVEGNDAEKRREILHLERQLGTITTQVSRPLSD